ncbi:hypothetical protein [Streptomyces sp. Da 82-17]|uniref:hypothetical protein n=1 Tax=Streptomyces sp. Da 82-17 TaxID=3377116 RepID=UPI0038D4E15C
MKLRRTAPCVAVAVVAAAGALFWALPASAATAALTLAVGAGMVAMGRHRPVRQSAR